MTPFGVHKDDKSAFQFIIAGRKKMRLWSSEFVERNPEIRCAHNYERFLDNAITFEAEAGDAMFWPESYWHVGESSEGLSICLSIGFYDAEESRAETELGRNLDRLIQRTSARANDYPMPAVWQELNDEDTVRADSRFPIEWLFVEDFRVTVSANGHIFPFLADERIVRLLELLNTGKALRAADLLTEFSGSARYDEVEFDIDPEGLRALLEKLLSLRAVAKRETEISLYEQAIVSSSYAQKSNLYVQKV